MSSNSSDDGDLDAGWDEPEQADSPEGAPPAAAMPPDQTATTPPGFEGVRAQEDRATVPPPVPESEYVARMMERARPSEGGVRIDRPRAPPSRPFRPPMPTIPEEDPLQFDRDDVATAKRGPLWDPPADATDAHARTGANTVEAPDSSTRRPVKRDSSERPEPIQRPSHVGDAPASTPSIEASYTDADDIDPDLLVDTPVPSHPPDPDGLADEFDDLPLDEVLTRVSQHSLPGLGGHTPVPDDDERVSRDVLVPPPTVPGLPPADFERTTLTGEQLADPISQVRNRFAAGDYSGALVVAEGMLEENPEHEEALEYAESCREMVRQMYLYRLGGGAKPLRIMMDQDQLKWLTLDHRTGFLLSRIDGETTVNELLDVSGMPALDALRILYELMQQEVLEIVER